MGRSIRRRRAVVAATAAATLVVGAVAAGAVIREHDSEQLPWKAHELFEQMNGEKDLQESSQGVANGGSGGEAFEAATASEQFAQHRGIVPPGGYTDALTQISGLSTLLGSWDERTNVPYDSDDPKYRDYYSNSSGGSGRTTGRITGIAADDQGWVYAGGADGGVWRKGPSDKTWTPIADKLGTLSTGDLHLDPAGHLWYATGEGNTGGTSYVGQGVFELTDPQTGEFTPATRVGGEELESTTIEHLRFDGDTAFVATSRGIWSHSTKSATGAWTLDYAPNPDYLPGGSKAGDPHAGYKNIVNDIAVDPKDATHLIAAIGWRSGDTYNGFYESRDTGKTWTKVNLQGGVDSIDSTDVGQTTFGFSADGSKLYAVVQSVALLQKTTGTVNSYLKGVYVSNNGSVSGPWTKIADSQKLANSGSALKQSVGGKGYGPGIQSWYNQFVVVDPANPQHLYVGLEEVYETKDGGSTWSTPGPYWNFYFGCWDYTKDSTSYPGPGATVAGCPATTHSDQHSAAIGTNAAGVPTLYVGNDGGIYSRPVDGKANADGHATDWTSLNDGSIDALQYYAVGVGPETGKDKLGGQVGSEIISGGLQDNGGSILRPGLTPGAMSSNFGGDGGDVLVDPTDGCNIVQEYVYLSMRVTNQCAESPGGDGFVNVAHANTRDIAPADVNARFIAPFDADRSDAKYWIAGGQHVWLQSDGFGIKGASAWKSVLDLATFTAKASPAHAASSYPVATAVAMNHHKAAVAWCGPCGEAFVGGVVYTDDITAPTPTWTDLGTAADVGQRYIGGVTIADDGTVYAVDGGFSRRFTDGPGADVPGHVWTFDGHGVATKLDGDTFPNVPANSVKMTPVGLVVGTDLGVFVQPKPGAVWQSLGSDLPRTTVMDVEYYGGKVYAATHGRGIWSIDLSSTSSTSSTTTKTTKRGNH